MVTTRDIQLVELEILKEIDGICREHNITYSIMGGTMLGAVRHNGFIPWDDDADICMDAKSVRKLGDYLNVNKYFLQVPQTDIEMPYVFYKVRKNKTFMEEEALHELNIHKGIWVDIFPLWNAPRNESLKKLQYFMGKILHSYRCRYYNARKDHPKRKYMARIPNKIALKIDSILIHMIEQLGNKKSDEYYIPCDETINHCFVKKKYFDELSEYIFEDTNLRGPNQFDEYLKSCYGNDYMTPKKYGHHIDYKDVIV